MLAKNRTNSTFLRGLFLSSIIIVFLLLSNLFARHVVSATSAAVPVGPRLVAFSGSDEPGFDAPALTEEQRLEIQNQIDMNIARLEAEGKLRPPNLERTVSMVWPVQLANNFPDFGAEAPPGQLDHDPAFGSKVDYFCGDRLNDGHRGTDFGLWPLIWTRMDQNQVEIVAGAAGVIVFKQDGLYDHSCGSGGTANAVYIRHEDGTTAWYGHLKTGSLTTKNVGDSVVAGEYLGLMGSSGNSSGPHLHLEMYTSDWALLDPFAGSCNTLNSESLWQSQPPYYQPAVNKISISREMPEIEICYPRENKDLAVYAPGEDILFTTYYVDLLPGQESVFTIYKPDGSVYATWKSIHQGGYLPQALATWAYQFDSGVPTGEWVFEVAFANNIYQQPFTILQDTSPPSCSVHISQGPQAEIVFVVKDSGVGLASITALQQVNASLAIPPFNIGTHDTVLIPAGVIQPNTQARSRVKVVDLNGNTAVCDGTYRLQSSQIVLSEDFSSGPLVNRRWQFFRLNYDFVNEAAWDSAQKNLYLTRNINDRSAAAFPKYELTSRKWEATFRYQISGGSGADGLTFMFYKNKAAYGRPIAGGYLGFSLTPFASVYGYGVEFDTFSNGAGFGDPLEPHIGLIQYMADNHLIVADDPWTEDGLWHLARIWYDNGLVTVSVDGQVAFRYFIENPDYSFNSIGFSAATGGLTNNHIVDDLVLRVFQ